MNSQVLMKGNLVLSYTNLTPEMWKSHIAEEEFISFHQRPPGQPNQLVTVLVDEIIGVSQHVDKKGKPIR